MWGYGFLCVTFINLCALLGMVFLPVMNKKYYKKLLMYMVALAVGTLAGSSLLILIPDVSTPVTRGCCRYQCILGSLYYHILI